MHLFQLPASEFVISCLWKTALKSNMADFAAKVLSNGLTSQALAASVMKECSPCIMREIVTSDDYLGVVLGTKLNWDDEVTALQFLNALAVFALTTSKPISDFYEV